MFHKPWLGQKSLTQAIFHGWSNILQLKCLQGMNIESCFVFLLIHSLGAYSSGIHFIGAQTTTINGSITLVQLQFSHALILTGCAIGVAWHWMAVQPPHTPSPTTFPRWFSSTKPSYVVYLKLYILKATYTLSCQI